MRFRKQIVKLAMYNLTDDCPFTQDVEAYRLGDYAYHRETTGDACGVRNLYVVTFAPLGRKLGVVRGAKRARVLCRMLHANWPDLRERYDAAVFGRPAGYREAFEAITREFDDNARVQFSRGEIGILYLFNIIDPPSFDEDLCQIEEEA